MTAYALQRAKGRATLDSSGAPDAEETCQLSRDQGSHPHGRDGWGGCRRQPARRCGARRQYADAGPAARALPLYHPQSSRHRGRHAQRRRHGQFRGRAQRPRRGPGLQSGRGAGQRRDQVRCAVRGCRLEGTPRQLQIEGVNAALPRPVLRRQRAFAYRSSFRSAAALRP